MTETRGRRQSMSFTPEQVIWLSEVMRLARRSNDFHRLMENAAAPGVQKIILTSAQKAALVSKEKPTEELGAPPPGKRKPMLAAFCHRGHPFVPDNTRHYTWKGKPRRACIICTKASRARKWEKTKEALRKRQAEAWAKLQEKVEAAE